MPEDVEVSGEALAESLTAVADVQPLIQELTNEVTMNDVANVTLYWGGLPVMSDEPGDAPEMVELAGGVLINTGRMSATNVEASHQAGERANDLGVPVVLDPVGAGATPTRREIAEDLLSSVHFAAIKGNYGEISTLAGVEAEVKGVESVGEYETIAETASSLAESTGSVVVASGVEDVVADPETGTTYEVAAGHELMGSVVGTGCMLGATIAAFCASVDDPFSACLHGTLAFGVAGERAAELPRNGPASYRINFLDAVASLDAEDVVDSSYEDRVNRVD